MIRPLQHIKTHQWERMRRLAEQGSWEQCRHLGAWFGLFRFHVQRAHYESAIYNLRQVHPGLSPRHARALVRRSVQSVHITYFETTHLSRASREEVREYASLHGWDEFERERSRGRGVILAVMHLSNYEITGARLAQEIPMTATGRPVGCSTRRSEVEQMRRNVGVEVRPPEESAFRMRQVLNEGNAVALFADLQGKAEEPVLPFFGYERRAITSPFRLAALTGARVMALLTIRRSPWLSNGHIDVQLRPLECSKSDSSAHTPEERVLVLARAFRVQMEEVLRRHPDQWDTQMWSHLRLEKKWAA